MSNSAVILIAIVGGIAVAVQSQFIGLIDTRLGTLESVFITYTGGAILATLTMLIFRPDNLKNWHTLPWYVFTAGFLGLIIIGTISFSVPRLGLANAFTIMVVSQFILGVLIDQYGWLGAEIHPLNLVKLVGLGFLLVGVALIMR